MKRVLIIEDEKPMREALADTLRDDGFEVMAAGDGAEGLRLAGESKPSLVLLDVMMPKVDGFTVCRELRRAGVECPVLMLTAKGSVDDRVEGLDAGADDYLVKPFSTRELMARVRALLRRSGSGEGPVLELGGWRMDFAAGTCVRNGEEVYLTAKEMGMVRMMWGRAGKVVTREEFLDEVWGYDAYPTTRTVDNHLASLRSKLEGKGTEFVQALLDLGAAVNTTPVEGEAPALYTAVNTLDVEKVKLVLAAGADVGALVDVVSVPRKGAASLPPVKAAIPTPQPTKATTRQRRVVLPPRPGSRGGAGQAGAAGVAGAPEGEAILVSLMRRLWKSASVGEMEAGRQIFKLLVDAGADVNAVTQADQMSVLQCAVLLDNHGAEAIVGEIIGELLKRGANPRALNEQGGMAIDLVKTVEAREALWGATYYIEFEGRGDRVWLSRPKVGQFMEYDARSVDSMARLISGYAEVRQRRAIPDLASIGILRSGAKDWETVDYVALCESGSVKDDIKLGGGDIVEFREFAAGNVKELSELEDLGSVIANFVQLASRTEVVVAVEGQEEQRYTVTQERRNSQVYAPGSEVPRSIDAWRFLTTIGVASRPDVNGGEIRVVRTDGTEVGWEGVELEHGDRVVVPLVKDDAEGILERRGRSLYLAREADGFIGRVASGREGVLGLMEEGVTWGIFLTQAYSASEKFFLPWPDLRRVRIDLMDGTSLAAREGEAWGFPLDQLVPWGSYVEIPALAEAEREGSRERYGLDEALMLAIAEKWKRTVSVRVDGGDLWPYEVTEADFGGYWKQELGGDESWWQVGSWPSAEMKGFDSRSIELRRFLDDTGYADGKKYETSKVMISVPRTHVRYVSGYSSEVLEDGTMITLRAVSGGP